MEDVKKWKPLQRGKGMKVTSKDQEDLFNSIQEFLRQPQVEKATTEGQYYIITESYLADKKPFNSRMCSPRGTQGMWRPLRSIILSHTADLDMECALQRTILWICRALKLYCNNLAFYVENRERMLEETSVADNISRDEAKQNYTIAITFNQRVFSKREFFNNYDSEMKLLQNKLFKHPEL
eukprot:7379219-Prymnesium_polylepis.1